MEEIKTVLIVFAVVGYYAWGIFSEMRYSKKVREERRNQRIIEERTVVARVIKEHQEETFWKCKYFKNGDHIGFFKEKPSGLRVRALLGEIDPKLGIRELYELRETV